MEEGREDVLPSLGVSSWRRREEEEERDSTFIHAPLHHSPHPTIFCAYLGILDSSYTVMYLTRNCEPTVRVRYTYGIVLVHILHNFAMSKCLLQKKKLNFHTG